MGVHDPASSPKARSAVNMFTAELPGAAAASSPKAAHKTATATTTPLSDADLELYRGFFDKFDADKSGSIDTAELSTLLSAMGKEMEAAQLSDMMQEADADGSGEIDQDEFIGLMSRHVGSQDAALEGELREAFELLDQDSSGTVDAAEIMSCCAELGERLSASEVSAMLKLVDADGSGEIDFEEFCAVARGVGLPRRASLPGDKPPEPAGVAAEQETFVPEVLRRKFRSVLHMLVLRGRIASAFVKVNNAAYQWQRFTDIEAITPVAAAMKRPIKPVPQDASIATALAHLQQTEEVCTALVDGTGTICGFVTILDIVQFITEQLKTEFTVQIDFSAQDVARQSVHGRQHLQQAWAVAEQHKVNMAADVLRARCLKLTQPPSAAIHTTPVSALICGRREVLQMRPGFTVSDVCRHLAEATSHRVPLVDWERRPLAVISQATVLEALAEAGQTEARVGPAASMHAEEIAEELSVVPAFSLALSAVQLLMEPEPAAAAASAAAAAAGGEGLGLRRARAWPGVAVVDAESGMLVGEVTIESCARLSGGASAISALSVPAGEFAAQALRRAGRAAPPTCRADTPLVEVLHTLVEHRATLAWLVDAQDRPRGMVTATALIHAICKAEAP